MKTDNLTDAMLVSRCQKGDRSALDILICRHEARAYQFAYKLTGNPEEAADVVSEAFIKVYRSVDRFNGDSAFSTWLYRILTNCFFDMRKKASRRATASLDNPLTADGAIPLRYIASNEDSPYDAAVSNARAERIDAAMEAIPACQKDVLALVHTGKLSYEDIAERLGVPMGTVKSRIFVARKSIRSLLGDELELFDVP